MEENGASDPLVGENMLHISEEQLAEHLQATADGKIRGAAGADPSPGAKLKPDAGRSKRKRRGNAVREKKPTEVTRNGSLHTKFFEEIVPDLSKEQVALIEQNGFGFVLWFVDYKPPLRVASWNLLNFNESNSKIVLDDGREEDIEVGDVEMVTGLRTGKSLLSTADARSKAKEIEELGRIFPDKSSQKKISPTSNISITEAKDTIRKMRGKEHMDAAQKEVFLKAVVIAAVVDLIAPKRRRRYLEPEVVAAIQDPEGPFVYNWAEYLLRALKDAADVFKKNIQSEEFGKTIHVPGCTIFLVVFYLLKFTKCGIPYCKSEGPLVKHFDADTMEALLWWDRKQRLLMPSYLILSTRHKVDRVALRNYINVKSTTKAVTKLPGWDISSADKGEDNGVLDGMITNYIDNRFSDLYMMVQENLHLPKNTAAALVAKNVGEPWFRQKVLERIEEGAATWFRALSSAKHVGKLQHIASERTTPHKPIKTHGQRKITSVLRHLAHTRKALKKSAEASTKGQSVRSNDFQPKRRLRATQGNDLPNKSSPVPADFVHPMQITGRDLANNGMNVTSEALTLLTSEALTDAHIDVECNKDASSTPDNTISGIYTVSRDSGISRSRKRKSIRKLGDFSGGSPEQCNHSQLSIGMQVGMTCSVIRNVDESIDKVEEDAATGLVSLNLAGANTNQDDIPVELPDDVTMISLSRGSRTPEAMQCEMLAESKAGEPIENLLDLIRSPNKGKRPACTHSNDKTISSSEQYFNDVAEEHTSEYIHKRKRSNRAVRPKTRGEWGKAKYGTSSRRGKRSSTSSHSVQIMAAFNVVSTSGAVQTHMPLGTRSTSPLGAPHYDTSGDPIARRTRSRKKTERCLADELDHESGSGA